MTEAAWATDRTRTRSGARFRRLARRFGKGHERKAAIAVARTLICIRGRSWPVARTTPPLARTTSTSVASATESI